MSAPLLSVIIPTHRKEAELARTLACLCQQTLAPDHFEVIVVDNAPSEETRRLVQALASSPPHFRYIVEERRGPGAARNAGIRHARGAYLLFLDDDIEVPDDHLAQHLRHHQEQPRSVILGTIVDTCPVEPPCLQRYLSSRNRLGSKPIASGNERLQAVDFSFFMTGNASVARRELETIAPAQGGQYFDEALHMREDADLGYRLARAGVRLYRDPALLCYHHHPRTWRELQQRSYGAGYYLHHLLAKHPELAAKLGPPRARSPLPDRLLLVSAAVAFGLGYPIQRVSPWLMFKGIGAWLLYHTRRGYRQAQRDAA